MVEKGLKIEEGALLLKREFFIFKLNLGYRGREHLRKERRHRFSLS
jgi:hypothetical protein